jgi:integrase
MRTWGLAMGRAARERTRIPGIYKRTIYGGRKTVYDIKIGNEWVPGTFTRLDDAAAERERLVVERRNGVSFARQPTFAAFVESRWRPRQQARVQQRKLRASTLNNYERDLANHILPALGERRLREVTVPEAQQLADDLSAAGLAAFTVNNILTALSSVFDLACKNGLASQNPVRLVEKPEARAQRETPSLTIAQVQRLAAAAPTTDDHNLVLVAAFAGLRISEAFGCRWENVILTPGAETLTVLEQFYKGEHVDRPKTRAGRREAPLCHTAAEALRSQLVESKRPNPLALVFPSVEGKHQRDSNWNRRVWQPTRERAELPGLHFHDLRHFFISHVSNAGLAPALAEQLVGQVDDRTHRGYRRPIPGTEQHVRDTLARAFTGESADG